MSRSLVNLVFISVCGAVLPGSTRRICTDDMENQNMLIHAVIEGWQSVGESGKHCPLWTVLQCVDLSISGAAERIERLVLLSTVHIMLLFQVGKLGRESLPTWFRPRPAQLKYVHHTVIDYLVWPGLRERLILDDNLKTTDKFWTLYAKCIRFNWPYNITACYKADPLTGMLSFTDLFKSQMSDVNNIQMTSEFFETFPEMADDIPMAQENLGQVFDMDQGLLENWDPHSVSSHSVTIGEGAMLDQANSVTGIFCSAEGMGLVDFQSMDNNRFLGGEI